MLLAYLAVSLTCLMGDVPEAVCWQEPEQPRDRLFARVDFLWWYLKKDEIPPLLTTGPDGTTGVPGDPGVTTFYGGSIMSRHDRFIGVRPTLGYWFNEEETVGLEATAFFVERDSSILHIKPCDFAIVPALYGCQYRRAGCRTILRAFSQRCHSSR